jgi:hypothetical protein
MEIRRDGPFVTNPGLRFQRSMVLTIQGGPQVVSDSGVPFDVAGVTAVYRSGYHEREQVAVWPHPDAHVVGDPFLVASFDSFDGIPWPDVRDVVVAGRVS